MELASYAERAVRLVNTADPGRLRDDLLTLDDLKRLMADHPTWAGAATRRDLEVLRLVRGRLRAIFEAAAVGNAPEAVRRLNRLLAEFPVRPQVAGHDGHGWHLHLAEGAPSGAVGFAAGACMGLAVVLTELGADRLGVCQAPPCREVYLDTSTNRSRRYCSDRCATRANVAAYRARRRAEAAAQA